MLRLRLWIAGLLVLLFAWAGVRAWRAAAGPPEVPRWRFFYKAPVVDGGILTGRSGGPAAAWRGA